MTEAKLTPMQQFALELLAKENEAINPGYLGTQWHVHQNGRLPRSASRDTFGLTSAAYKTLRRLADLGMVTKHLSRSHSLTIETYELKRRPKLTPAQQYQIDYIRKTYPTQWFGVMDVFPQIKRGYYALTRLETVGLLKSRMNDGEKQWRLIQNN